MRLLLLRQESFDRAPDVLARFLGITSPVAVPRRNDGTAGPLAEAYRRFLASPHLPAALLDEAYDSPYARHFYAEHAPDETWACDWLSGCFLMVRRAAIEQVGRFDERYGKYFEDVDMSLRMARAGWQVMYHGAASCYHLEQRASKSFLALDAWRHLRAYVRWLGKWGIHPSPAVTLRPYRRAA